MGFRRYVATAGALAILVVMAGVAVLTAPSGAASKTVRNGLIAYTVGNGDEDPYVVRTVKPNGTQNRTLLRPDRKFPGGPAGPRWSRDGKKLLFAQYPYSSDGDTRVRSLWYSTPAGKQIRRIPLGPRRVLLGGYDWAPDGRRIVFAATRRFSPTDTTIYTISIDGTHRKALRRGSGPSWSNDGRYILFTRSLRLAESKIAVVRPNGTGFRKLTGFSHDSSPSFSPGGQKVVYVRSPPLTRSPEGGDVVWRGHSEWRTVDVTGRNDVLIATYEHDDSLFPQVQYSAPQWTPDGTRLAAVRASGDGEFRTSELVTVAPRAGARERVAFKFPGQYWIGDACCDFSWQRSAS
jgi:Tol biopolymer transport system component